MEEIKAYVGINLAKDISRVAVIDENGQNISSCFSIPNYWENVYSLLKEKGYFPILLNPYQVRKYSQTLGDKVKTDSVDASCIAKFLRSGDHESPSLTSEDAITLRELVRIKYSFESRIKDLKRSVLYQISYCSSYG